MRVLKVRGPRTPAGTDGAILAHTLLTRCFQGFEETFSLTFGILIAHPLAAGVLLPIQTGDGTGHDMDAVALSFHRLIQLRPEGLGLL